MTSPLTWLRLPFGFGWAILLLACLTWPNPSQAESLMFEHLLAEDDDPTQTLGPVLTITQDTDGYIWVGGHTGLARYDGHNMRFYRKGEKGLNATVISRLVPDGKGNIWVGTWEGLYLYNPNKDHFDHLINPLALTPKDNEIRALAMDAQHNIWFGTPTGLTRLSADHQHFRHFTLDPSAHNELSVRALLIDRQQRLWIGTLSGLYLVATPPNGNEPLEAQVWRAGAGDRSLQDDAIVELHEDTQGRIWIGTFNQGVDRLGADLTHLDHYRQQPGNQRSLPGKIIHSIVSDKEGQVWIALEGGLVRYDETSNDFTRFSHSDSNRQSLSTDALLHIFIDRDSDMWIGSNMGVNYFNQATRIFTNYSHITGRKNSLTNNAVMAIMEDSDGELWVGTENGLNRFDRSRTTITRYQKDVGNPKALQADPILSLAQDGDGDIWVGSWSGGLYRFNKTTEEFRHYAASDKPGALASPYIWDLAFDQQHRLWIATQTSGLQLFEPDQNRFRRWMPDPRNPHAISYFDTRNLLPDPDGSLWVAANTGGLNRFDILHDTFEQFRPVPDQPSIPSVNITKLMRHSNGDVWIGTQDSGLAIWHRARQQGGRQEITRIGQQAGLVSNAVASMVEDDKGDVWVTTLNGVSRIRGYSVYPGVTPAALSIKNFTKQQGLASNSYNRDASYKDAKGNIYLGGTEGFSIFHPDAIVENTQPPKVMLSQLRINDHPQLGPHTDEQSLAHDQNTLEFEFSAMSYRAARSNLYQYRLDGFDTAWNAPGPNYHVAYNHLAPGRYRFRVRAANSDGVWSTDELTYAFRIAPLPWQSPWAYGFYLLCGLAMALLVGLWQARRLELSSERRLNDELRQLNKMKDTFLANTSHELRTPLNGIIGLTESLVSGDSGEHNSQTHLALEVILKSGRRMAHLVSDILDFAKLNERKVKLQKTPLNLCAEVNTTFALLTPIAQAKHLLLINAIAPDLATIKADVNRLQQILLNLIGNAIKFTEAGTITVTAVRDNQGTQVSICDTGIGIAPQDLQTIFSAFSQVADSDTRSQGGSGLGLAICQQLVELHGGEIRVVSELGVGTTVKIILPLE